MSTGEVRDAADERCESPPCLPESLPDPASVPIALPVVLIALAVVLGAPTLLVGMLTLFRGGRRLFSTGLLVVVGPLLVLVGSEIVPHVANPCLVGEVSTICASTKEYGVDFADRFHALGHAVIGTLPFTAAYWWVLRRWRPEVLRR